MTLFRSGARAELLGNAALAQGPLSLTAREVTLFYGSVAREGSPAAEKCAYYLRKRVFGDAAVWLVSAEMTVTVLRHQYK